MSLISSAKSLTTHSRTVPPQAQCGRMMALKLAARPVSKLRTHTNPRSGDFSVTPGPLACFAAASMSGARKPGRGPVQVPVGRVLANATPTARGAFG
jgi:hypothetical protein